MGGFPLKCLNDLVTDRLLMHSAVSSVCSCLFYIKKYCRLYIRDAQFLNDCIISNIYAYLHTDCKHICVCVRICVCVCLCTCVCV